jgi:hypothetical protein
MSKLDISRPYGKVAPPCEMPGGARAFYEQDGKLYDAHHREIIPGAIVKQAVAPAPVADLDPLPPPTPREEKPVIEMTAQEILDGMDAMGWAELQKKAKQVLGGACPPGKAAIRSALEAAIKGHAERIEKRKLTAERGATQTITPGRTIPTPDFDPPSEDAPAVAPSPAPKSAAPVGGPVDLAAWGRGQREYVFSEIRKAIRAQYNAAVMERSDAIDFLIDNKIITGAEARRDIPQRQAAA